MAPTLYLPLAEMVLARQTSLRQVGINRLHSLTQVWLPLNFRIFNVRECLLGTDRPGPGGICSAKAEPGCCRPQDGRGPHSSGPCAMGVTERTNHQKNELTQGHAASQEMKELRFKSGLSLRIPRLFPQQLPKGVLVTMTEVSTVLARIPPGTCTHTCLTMSPWLELPSIFQKQFLPN